MQQWLNVGKVVNTHGLKGEVRVQTITDFVEQRYRPGNTLYLFRPGTDEPCPVVVKSHRKHKDMDLLQFENVEHIDDVEHWKGGMLKVSVDQLEPLDDGEFYIFEIIGCEVKTISGKKIGIVKEILRPGANDVWIVKGMNGHEYLIPYIKDVVKDVNVKEKQITIEPMEGLLS